ncbi:MAG: ABC transporter ATP-binding protein [Candidatus Accumulibacter sp.]|jgi:ABC-2 type transport system ATP-binding protein|nr:ABC transporter ATP-binding protein [Accumulibacter sp.]
MIRVEKLVKSYQGVLALDALSLTVEKGELFAFLGPNGAGKTTTIRILNGLSTPTSGRAFIDSVDVSENPLGVKRLCGLAAQHINLDGDLTVAENMDVHGRLYGLSRKDRRTRCDELLAEIDLADRADARVNTLSGGLKRRLMIARALMHRPRVLFLDEPTVGLDPAIRRRLWGLIKKVRRDGVTVFMTTHYIEEAEFLADRVAFVHHGKLAALGTPTEITRGVGRWAVDFYRDAELQSAYFDARDDADEFIAHQRGEFSVRRVNLEDAFLDLTGQRTEDRRQNGLRPL